jgi:hypothetical protein
MVHQSGKVGWSAASCGNAGTRRDDGIFGGLAVLYAGRFPARRARRFVDSSGSRRRSTRRSWLRPSRNSSRTHCGSRGNGPAFGVPQPLVVAAAKSHDGTFLRKDAAQGAKNKTPQNRGVLPISASDSRDRGDLGQLSQRAFWVVSRAPVEFGSTLFTTPCRGHKAQSSRSNSPSAVWGHAGKGQRGAEV